MTEKNQLSKGRVMSIKRPVDVTDDDTSDPDEMEADLGWSSSPGHTSDEDGIRPRIVESERFSITSDDIPNKPHEWGGGASFSENDDDQQAIAYEPPPQRPLTVPGQKPSNRNLLGVKTNDPTSVSNANNLQLQQQDNRMSDRQIKSYNAIVQERPQTTVGVQVGITSWDWLSRLEQLLIHFFLIIFDSSSDFSKTLMEVFPVEASAQIEEIFRLLLQADPEMYENLGYLVGMAEKWLVQWNSKSSTKKEALEFIRLYMIGCKHRNYYNVPIYARLQKLGAFISGLQNLSGTGGGGDTHSTVFTAKQIKDYNLESDPPAIEKAAWEKRLPSPRVKPASHFARVVAHILCDRPCERPMTSPDIYADPITKTCVPTNLATETELTTLTDAKYGSQYSKRDLFFYPVLALPRDRPVKVDPCNKKCWLPIYTESYVEMVRDEMDECGYEKGGKENAATAAARARLRRKKIEQYEVEYEYEYEDEPEYEYEYEYEIELDKDGNPIFGADGKPKLRLGPDGKPILKLGADGKPILLLGADGKPIVRRGSNGQPIIRRDSKGRIIYKIGPDGKRVPKLDENGKPILKLNSQGQPIVKLGKDGKPIIKMENGRPVYKLGADGKRVKRIPGSQESLIDEKGRRRKMGGKTFHEKEIAREQEKKDRLKNEADLEKKKKKKEKRELDRLKAKDEREHRKGGKGKKGKRGNRKNRGSDDSDEDYSDEELSDGTGGTKKRHKRKARKSEAKSEANSLGAREAGKSKTSGEIIPGESQRKSQDAGKDAVRVGYALTGESGAVAVKRANRKAQELAKAKAKANEKGEQKSDRKYGDDDKKKLLKNNQAQGDIDFDVDFEETVETFPMLSVRKKLKSRGRLESYPDDFGDASTLPVKSKKRAGDKDQQLRDALSKNRLRDVRAVSGKRRTEIRKPPGKEFKNVNVREKVERTVYRPPSRIRQPRKTQGLFGNESSKDRANRLAHQRAGLSLQRLRKPIHLKRTFRYPGGQFDYDRKFGQGEGEHGRSDYTVRNARSEGVLSGGTADEEEACYYFPTKFECRPPKKLIRERILPNNFPRDAELANLNTCWDLDSDLFKKPMKGIGIPPPENILAHIEKLFPRLKWPKGSPLAVRYYPNGRIFCATFKNGSGEVFYPHGGLAIAISNPDPVNRVLIIRDPYDKFYFMDKAILADLDCSGTGCVYNSDGAISLQYNSIGGFRLQGVDNCSQRWTWIRGGQRIILKLNRYMSLRILDFNRIHLVFNGNKRGVRFNVGPGRIINLMNVEADEKSLEAGKPSESCYDDHFDNRGKFTTPTLGFFDNSRFCPEILPDPSLCCPLDCNSKYFRCAVSDPCLCDCVN